MYIKTTPSMPANSKEIRIRFAPMVSHQIIKYGFNPVSAKPISNKFLLELFVKFVFSVSFNELRICIKPKTMRATPPMAPTAKRTVGSFETVKSPKARSITKVNSIIVWDMENSIPLFAPDFAPWDMVTKNSGPGARAPEIVKMITVAAKLRGSMSN